VTAASMCSRRLHAITSSTGHASTATSNTADKSLKNFRTNARATSVARQEMMKFLTYVRTLYTYCC